MRDLKDSLDVLNSLTPAARTASANGAGVDLQGFEGACVVLVAGTLTDGTHTPSVEESDVEGSGYTAVAAADLEGAFVAATTLVNQRVGYKGTKKYIRGVLTVAGATTGMVAGMAVVRGIPHRSPVA